MRYNQLTNERILSIDAFRGITILVMIFVNALAGMRDIPSWMQHMHADDDAMSFVDAVFPAFLFIVGMSIPFAINSRLAKGDSFWQLQWHILFRTLGLLVLGFFLVNAEGGYDKDAMLISINLWALLFFVAVFLIWKVYRTRNKTLVYVLKAIGFVGLLALALAYKPEGGGHITPQWWGILGLIGWAYLYACIAYQVLNGNKYWMALLAAACIAIYIVGHNPRLSQMTVLHWTNKQSGNAAHTSIVLCGTILSLIFFDKAKSVSTQNRFIQALAFAGLLFESGFLLRPYFKISKIYATPTWCLYSAGFCVVLFSLLYWLIDIKKAQSWTAFFKPAASNPLLTYIIPDIVYFISAWAGFSIFPSALSYGVPGMILCAIYAVAVMAVVMLLNKMKLKLQL